MRLRELLLLMLPREKYERLREILLNVGVRKLSECLLGRLAVRFL